MAIEKDKYIDPNDRARWGFGGSEGNITVGPQTVGETGGVETARTPVDETEARGNGGGVDSAQVATAAQAQVEPVAEQQHETNTPASDTTAADQRDDLTKDEIKAELDAKGISYASTANKAELLEQLKAAQ